MEASLLYIAKRYNDNPTQEQFQLLKNIQHIRKTLQLCQTTNKKLLQKVKEVYIISKLKILLTRIKTFTHNLMVNCLRSKLPKFCIILMFCFTL